MPSKQQQPKFPLGRMVATPGALNALLAAGQGSSELIWRHLAGDWGDLDEADKAENEMSLKEGFLILSAYILRSGDNIWIITEADRSATTLLLPEEY